MQMIKVSNIKILVLMVELEMWGKLFPIMKAAAWGDKGQDSCPLNFFPFVLTWHWILQIRRQNNSHLPEFDTLPY